MFTYKDKDCFEFYSGPVNNIQHRNEQFKGVLSKYASSQWLPDGYVRHLYQWDDGEKIHKLNTLSTS